MQEGSTGAASNQQATRFRLRVSKDVTEGRAAHEGMEPSMRWCMFWLFIATYGLSVALAVRGSTRQSWAAYLPLAILTLAAAGLAAMAWQASRTVADRPSGLLAWLDLLPDWLVQCLHLAAMIILVSSLVAAWPWGTGMTQLGMVRMFVGMGLLLLAMCCGPRPFRFRRLHGG